MFLYNVTLILEDAAATEWLQWMEETHVPAVMATGMFSDHKLLKVVDSPNEGVTYCAQYIADTIEKYNEYLDVYAPALQAELQAKFENRFVAYRTLMEFV